MSTLLSVILEAAASAELIGLLAKMGAAFATSFIVWGAAYGIGKIGEKAMDAIARQPEAANDIRGSMIVVAALIEGASFFAIVVCLLVLFV